MTPQVGWQVAVDLYVAEAVSLGRAAEISGLPTVVFMETLHNQGISLVTAQSTEVQKVRRKALIHAGFNLPGP
ncbi:MAG: hypothetical protein DYG89_30615 [Caldilinea sp. CFX5]|nr:hypothetical protein [Caldilinea sp. CFX5]